MKYSLAEMVIACYPYGFTNPKSETVQRMMDNAIRELDAQEKPVNGAD